MRVQHHGSVCVVSGTVNLLKEQFDREFSHPTPRLTHGGNWVNSWIAGPEGVAILESGWDLRLCHAGQASWTTVKTEAIQHTRCHFRGCSC